MITYQEKLISFSDNQLLEAHHQPILISRFILERSREQVEPQWGRKVQSKRNREDGFLSLQHILWLKFKSSPSGHVQTGKYGLNLYETIQETLTMDSIILRWGGLHLADTLRGSCLDSWTQQLVQRDDLIRTSPSSEISWFPLLNSLANLEFI